MRPIDSTKAIDSMLEVAVSFDFGPMRVTLEELDEFMNMDWFPRNLARLPEGVLKRFNLKFHQLNPSSFMKLCIFLWACKSLGVKPYLEGFIHLHRVHL